MQTLSGRQLGSVGQQRLRPGALLVCKAATNSKVTFKVVHRVQYGQQLCIAGSDPAMGQWDPNQALVLNWSDGDVWHAEADIPPG